jgi:hypothetical protein
MDSLKEAIEQRPWSSEEKSRVLDILQRGREKKSKKIRFLDELTYWIFLLIAVAGNFILSVVLVPFMLILTGFYLFAILFVIALAFGILLNTLLKEIQQIESKQHIIPIIFIIAIALINVYIITVFTNKLEILLQLSTPAHSPVLISATYTAAFVIPYLYSEYRRATKKRKQLGL